MGGEPTYQKGQRGVRDSGVLVDASDPPCESSIPSDMSTPTPGRGDGAGGGRDRGEPLPVSIATLVFLYRGPNSQSALSLTDLEA